MRGLTKRSKSLGVDPDAIARGEGRDALAKLLVQRAKARFAGRAPGQPPASAAGALTAGKGADISIDKAWHGVHYLLCGRAVPGSDLASQVVMGGTDVGDDLGYGPARYFTPDQVAAIARELSRPNLEAEMDARFDPDQMMQLGIYPVQFDDPDDRDWLMDEFRKLRQFYARRERCRPRGRRLHRVRFQNGRDPKNTALMSRFEDASASRDFAASVFASSRAAGISSSGLTTRLSTPIASNSSAL